MAANNQTETNERVIVPFLTNGRKVYVVSDLHIAAGLNKSGNYEGTENFYADQSFVRFTDHLQEKLGNAGGLLIINGDFVDFLRICDIPETNADFRTWQEILVLTGIDKTIDELKSSIVQKERDYGLKTHDYKSIWKLHVCMHGHQSLFNRLARWVYDGNELIVVKGNHDLEWYWPAVQQYLRIALQRLLPADLTNDTLRQTFKDRIYFVDHALTLDNKIYIEHGHLYERTTAVVGAPTLSNGEELNLPFGSFFNRYLINRLELSYPFLDNVRPSQNILPVLIRERFPLAVKVMFHYIPFMLLIIPKGLYWYTFKYLLNTIIILVLPVLLTLFALYQVIKGSGPGISTAGIPKFILNIVQSFGFLFLSYIFGRIMAMADLKSPPTLSLPAKKIMDKNPAIEAVLFGHTHDPEQRLLGQNQWYFNTGTWIPIFETSSADVRFDKTYTFIAIDTGEMPPCSERLQRWNDDAVREDAMILSDRS